jgi:hypothetical protein
MVGRAAGNSGMAKIGLKSRFRMCCAQALRLS